MVTSKAFQDKMPATLLLAPAAQGKTEHAVRRIAAAHADSPLSPIVVLLPSHTQVEAFRARLASQGQALGVRLFTFYDLDAELLAQTGRLLPQLDGPVQTDLLRRLTVTLAGQGRLDYFAPLLDKAGFPATLRETIQVLKRARLEPKDFAAAVAAEQ